MSLTVTMIATAFLFAPSSISLGIGRGFRASLRTRSTTSIANVYLPRTRWRTATTNTLRTKSSAELLKISWYKECRLMQSLVLKSFLCLTHFRLHIIHENCECNEIGEYSFRRKLWKMTFLEDFHLQNNAAANREGRLGRAELRSLRSGLLIQQHWSHCWFNRHLKSAAILVERSAVRSTELIERWAASLEIAAGQD